MKGKLIRGMYLWNLVVQSILSLLSPIAVCTLAAYLLERSGTGSWIYAVLILLGVLIGLSSMVRFVLSASRALERLEGEHKEKDEKQRRR